jgi:hypothetical protein
MALNVNEPLVLNCNAITASFFDTFHYYILPLNISLTMTVHVGNGRRLLQG